MRKEFNHIIAFIILSVFAISCEERTDWALQEFTPQKLVVDAIITDELRSHQIYVRNLNSGPNQQPEGVSGVSMAIVDEDTNIYAVSEIPEDPGHYGTDVFQAVAGKHYVLFLEYKGFIDTALAIMEGITPLKDLQIEDADEGLLKLTEPDSDGPAMTEIYYDWSSVPGFCESYGSCYAAEVYYKINYIDIIREFAPARTEMHFPPGTIVYRRKYSLTEAHQEFIRSLLIETEWRGGLFDVEYGNVGSNFRNGSLGFFGACMVLTDTTVVYRPASP